VLILISGPHGSGKSTVAKEVARRLGLKYVSAGEIFRLMALEKGMSIVEFTKYVEENPEIDYEIDKRMMKEMETGNAVVDSLLAYYFSSKIRLGDIIVIRMMIYADKEVRIRRLMAREGIPRDEAEREIQAREESEKHRFKKLYGIDLWKEKDFDVIVNTSRLTIDQMIDLCLSIIKKLIQIKSSSISLSLN